jgi:hypothetical protein
VLQKMGYKNIDFHSYPGMPHSLCHEEQEDVAKFISKVRAGSTRVRAILAAADSRDPAAGFATDGRVSGSVGRSATVYIDGAMRGASDCVAYLAGACVCCVWHLAGACKSGSSWLGEAGGRSSGLSSESRDLPRAAAVLASRLRVQ